MDRKIFEAKLNFGDIFDESRAISVKKYNHSSEKIECTVTRRKPLS